MYSVDDSQVLDRIIYYAMNYASHPMIDRATQKPIEMHYADLEDMLEGLDLKTRHKWLLLNYINTRSWQRAFRMSGSNAKPSSINCMLFKMKQNKDFVQALRILENWFIVNSFITKENVLAELAKIAFGDIADYITWTEDSIELKPSELLQQKGIDTSLISEITVSHTRTGKNVKLKLYDRMAALKLIGTHLKMFTERVELTGPDGGPIQITHALQQSIQEIYGEAVETGQIEENGEVIDAESKELPLKVPNMSLDEMSVEWEEEEYLATQGAIEEDE